jgi:hypothetical protein
MAVQNFGSGGGGFQLSPGINISEIDLTTVVPPVATTVGAIAGVFRWGPVNDRVLVTSENDLVARFGKPANLNAETFFTAANFLSYSNALYVVRAGNTTSNSTLSAVAGPAVTESNSAVSIMNDDDYETKVGDFPDAVIYVARHPGAIGNSLKVSVCDSATAYNSTIELPIVSNSTVNTAVSYVNATSVGTSFNLSVGNNVGVISIANGGGWSPSSTNAIDYANSVSGFYPKLSVGDYIEVGNNSLGKQYLKITEVGSITPVNTGETFTGTVTINLTFDQPLKLAADIAGANSIARYWEYFNQVDAAPGTSTFVSVNGNSAAVDELHLVVVDQDGEFTGSPGLVLEKFTGLSRAEDAKLSDGSTNYYKTVINEQSQYIRWANDRNAVPSANALQVASAGNTTPLTLSFEYGTDNDEASAPFTQIASAYDRFASAEDVDISLVLTGRSRGGTNGEQLANYLIDNIAEVRKDCVVFVSPTKADVVNNPSDATDDVVTFRNSLRSTSFAVMDSGYKYQYDKYNDLYRFVPLNGDIAGLCVRTDNVRDPWYSPAGANRGSIRNVVKLPYNPNKAQRDQLYKNGVNPVITQPGQGTLLFGDKTLLARPSAFDRINVRRLFIVLEKAISTAAKNFLFEFNDEFTRTQFRNLIEPFLRDVQGRRGIYDFKVVCDDTNNTPEVIDSGRFVGDIYIKPARSINFIQLNFVAVRSGIEFSEIVG